MKASRLRLPVLLVLLLAVTTVAVRKWTQKPAPPLLPQPTRAVPAEGFFEVTAQTPIWTDSRAEGSARELARALASAAGWEMSVRMGNESGLPGQGENREVRFETPPGPWTLGPEGYRLNVSPRGTSITASEPAGWFYGLQTFLQLFPPDVYRKPESPREMPYRLPCVQVEDQPRFAWRGFMLDVARHFFDEQEVERVIHGLAAHKLNRFHFHLTDDQGWRLEIKRYPALTDKGAWRNGIGFRLDPAASKAYGPDGRYGGFYSHEEVRRLVQFAAERHVLIVPEIEMPGHASAALSAYPELSCSGGPFSTDLNAGIFDGVFCPGKEETFEFIANVLAEVAALFPGPFIHIGGDEVPKGTWRNCPRCQERMRQEGLQNEQELQAWFIRRVSEILKPLDRRLIGWSEVRHGGLPASAVLMDWIGGGLESAREGRDVIMAPFGFAYFDHYQSTNRAAEPKGVGGFIPWEKVYAFEPVPEALEPRFHDRILGPQANLWTEYIASLPHVEYMMYPRLCAMAEVAWSPADKRDFTGFTARLRTHLARLQAMGIEYRKLDETH